MKTNKEDKYCDLYKIGEEFKKSLGLSDDDIYSIMTEKLSAKNTEFEDMNNDIFALVDYANYGEYNFMFIKIKKYDKEKFREFIKDTNGFGFTESLTIRGWITSIEVETTDENGYELEIKTIQEYQKYSKYELDMLDEMKEHHYLFGKRDKFVKLLEYKFLDVK